jgi:hypothetical protein
MDATDLRCCPHCANEKLIVASVITEGGEARCGRCPECGAHGPMATNRDPPGYAEFLWGARYGADHLRAGQTSSDRPARCPVVNARGSSDSTRTSRGSMISN